MNTKKIVTALSLLLLTLFLVCCGDSETHVISCEEIVNAYESAGYTVSHSAHQDETFPYKCMVSARKNSDDCIYFYFFSSNEDARKAAEIDKYNLAEWIFALPFGEYRWLNVGIYGNIEYSYYDTSLIRPFQKLVKTKNG